jgi:glycine/D-amino acid oxidase-like deaminating enzyme
MSQTLRMQAPATTSPWGEPPWKIDFVPQPSDLPEEADFAVVGGGFTGLAAAAWLRHADPSKSVVVLEASRIGAGASGRTGGIVLTETAGGDVPGLGDVLAGLQDILKKLEVECDLSLPGVWEVGRTGKHRPSPIEWSDSGRVVVVDEYPGGSLDPGKLASGLARAADRLGAKIFEESAVKSIEWGDVAALMLERGILRAKKVLFATNALSLGLSGVGEHAEPRLTLAVATEPLREDHLEAIGMADRRPFYTVDLPYLWGRVCVDNSLVFGSGLVAAEESRDLGTVTIASGESARLMHSLEARVRGLHPALKKIHFTHRWGGPILFRESWFPIFDWHPHSRNAIVVGAYAGHGVALSCYFGAWSAEAFLRGRELPAWGKMKQ